MGKPVNLRRFRKQKARDAARKAGDENAARHGQSKAEAQRSTAEARLEARRLDAHRRPGDPDP